MNLRRKNINFWTITITLLVLLLGRTTFAQKKFLPPNSPFRFHSYAGGEYAIQFQSVYQVEKSRAEELLKTQDQTARQSFIDWEVRPVMPYLMGPTTHRGMGSPKRQETIRADWANVKYVGKKAFIPYTYEAIWILNKEIAAQKEFSLPVPLNEELLFTENWKDCGDSEPDHQTRSFFWYFWDPARSGCEHVEGKEYQTVTVTVGEETPNLTESYPEYERLVRVVDGQKTITMTFAFGYVNDPRNPRPKTDSDAGVIEYRDFQKYVRRSLPNFSEREILQSEYEGGYNDKLVIGSEFTGTKDDIHYRIKVVVNAGVDQMYLFAKSYAEDKDGFFAWFGHSRVGSGFDADQFRQIVASNPQKYSITDLYQIIYWGGCNSYTYYTLPFFKTKSELTPETDPNGTKNLDIISNGMPSFFALNSKNAQISFDALMLWPQERTSYQTWIQAIESETWGPAILTNVLGDEDNALPPKN